MATLRTDQRERGYLKKKSRKSHPLASLCVSHEEGRLGFRKILSCNDAHFCNGSALGLASPPPRRPPTLSAPSRRQLLSNPTEARNRNRASPPPKTSTARKSRTSGTGTGAGSTAVITVASAGVSIGAIITDVD